MTFQLPDVLALSILVSLTFYVLLGGADFGGGVWDLLASGPRKREQRSLVADAIGPVWEANHVWLILVVVLLFTCFPPAFAGLGIVLHIPLTLMLIGIVLRGTAFTFRTYDSKRDDVQRRWGGIFAIASLVTPVLLGVCIGAIASGRVGEAIESAAAGGFAPGTFRATYVTPWLTPFAFAVGALALALFAFLAAVYLTLETDDAALREDFRRRALGAAAAVFVSAVAALALAFVEAPGMGTALVRSWWSIPLHVVTGAAAVSAIVALWTRRYAIARIAAAGQATLILWGWGAAQYPLIVPPEMTIHRAAAPERTLSLVLGALVIGALVLFPSLWYLFAVFKRRETAFVPIDGKSRR
ncbi:MAG TPA: cytochrome d ubiquinol oxidase subunit II [Gemmatimonadaceae bacterium]|nr:cytochrome d ubiquinol oxidase subunit II [Gemmatimonadaceae bacterium]